MYKRGLGMPLPCDNHQDVIDFLYGNLWNRLDKKTRPFLKQNRTADEVKGKNEVVPDISLFSRMNYDEEKNCWQYTGLILNIEVVRDGGAAYSEKSIEKLFRRCDTLKEAFLYNYESHIWSRYTRQGDGEIIVDVSDFSRLLRLHLNNLAKVGRTFEDVLKLC